MLADGGKRAVILLQAALVVARRRCGRKGRDEEERGENKSTEIDREREEELFLRRKAVAFRKNAGRRYPEQSAAPHIRTSSGLGMEIEMENKVKKARTTTFTPSASLPPALLAPASATPSTACALFQTASNYP